MTKENLWKTFRKPGGSILSLKKKSQKNDFLEAKKRPQDLCTAQRTKAVSTGG